MKAYIVTLENTVTHEIIRPVVKARNAYDAGMKIGYELMAKNHAQVDDYTILNITQR